MRTPQDSERKRMRASLEPEERILDYFIQSIDNKKLIEKGISKTWDLTRFHAETSQTEDIARQN